MPIFNLTMYRNEINLKIQFIELYIDYAYQNNKRNVGKKDI